MGLDQHEVVAQCWRHLALDPVSESFELSLGRSDMAAFRQQKSMTENGTRKHSDRLTVADEFDPTERLGRLTHEHAPSAGITRIVDQIMIDPLHSISSGVGLEGGGKA
jgi:hypothetical protein